MNYFKRSALLGAVLYVGAASAATYSYPRLNRTLSADSAYVEAIHSNRGYASFASEYLGLLNTPFDFFASTDVVANNAALRFLWAAGNGALVYFVRHEYLELPLFLAMHEGGHGTRVTAAGSNPFYGFFASDGSLDMSNTYDDFFTYFVAALLGQKNGGFTSSTAGGGGNLPGLATSAGGINNSQYMGHYMEEQAYREGGHFLNLYYYIDTKLDGAHYVDIVQQTGFTGGGDVGNLVNGYAAQGYNISYNDLRLNSYIGLVASSHSYAYLWTFFKYVFTGDPRVKSFEIGPVRLPDVDSYYNSDGISLKVKSGLRFGNLRFPFALEYQYKGAMRAEGSVGVRWDWNQATLSSLEFATVIGNGGVNFEAQMQLRFARYMGFTVGVAARNYNTLDGERLTTSSSSDYGFTGFGKFSIFYF